MNSLPFPSPFLLSSFHLTSFNRSWTTPFFLFFILFTPYFKPFKMQFSTLAFTSVLTAGLVSAATQQEKRSQPISIVSSSHKHRNDLLKKLFCHLTVPSPSFSLSISNRMISKTFSLEWKLMPTSMSSVLNQSPTLT